MLQPAYDIDDLVARLRSAFHWAYRNKTGPWYTDNVPREAADALIAQQGEIKLLRQQIEDAAAFLEGGRLAIEGLREENARLRAFAGLGAEERVT